ncbi:XRE family transcriptional regulator [soil metagenome]
MSEAANTTEHRWLNPDVLKWAREWRGRTLEEAANRARKDVEVIEAWERGEKTPTVKQARKLADYYDRHFLELLLPYPPELPEPVRLPDFRMHHGVKPPVQEWELQDILQWTETQRINALDLYGEIGEQPPEFPEDLFASLRDNHEVVAARSRELLDFPIQTQVDMTLKDTGKLPDILRHQFERIGVLTLKRSDLAKLRVRGICIAEFPLPAIVFTKESPGAQAFSLVHEFAHVLLRRSGVSGPLDRRTERKSDIERWCNRFTGAFLMPEGYLRMVVGPPPALPADRIEDARLKKAARKMSVSEHAMLIRLVHLGYVHRDYYWNEKRPEFERQEEGFNSRARSNYYGSRYRSTQGDLYTGLVMEAWGTDRITNHNAAEFMGIKNLRHLNDIRQHFGTS